MPKRRSHTTKVKICPKHGKKILRDRVEAELIKEHVQLRSRREIYDVRRTHPCEFGYGWHLTSEEQRSGLPYSA